MSFNPGSVWQLGKDNFGPLLDLIPKGKRAANFQRLAAVEVALNLGGQALNLLRLFRDYLIETGGPDQPFVRQIDKLLPR
jgi:hypothetical protein